MENFEPIQEPEMEEQEDILILQSEETPICQAEPESDSVYHGAGVGKKESPFAASPYYTASEARQHTAPEPQPVFEAPKPKKQRKPLGKVGKGILAALLALAVVAGSCGITANVINARWEQEVAQLEQEMDAKLEKLESKLNEVSAIGSGTSVSGSPVSAEGLTPGQVYAMNVNSVVSIGNYAKTSSGFWGSSSGGSMQLISSGSGFIVSTDGYVVTNYHVIEGCEKLTVTTHTGDEYEATLIGYDQLNDVALLKADAQDLDAVEIGSSDDLIVGDQVVAIGHPLGELTSTMTVGYISGKDRSVTTDGSIINMLQTDAAINSGNSGGPLFNMKGQVVGITTAKYSGSSSSGASIEGIGFAIPIDDIIGMIEDFRDYGYVRNQAYLGVMVRDMDATTAASYGLPTGSYVTSVEAGSAAEKAGILPQDIIIAVADYEVGSNTELTLALRRFSAGDSTTITVFRSGAEIVLPITFDERPQTIIDSSDDPLEQGEMPNTGSYQEWYDYFERYFGNRGK